MKKIEDFGEKIGGARKDLWKERGLLAGDLEEMNEREADKFVKKDNIWKKPDYDALVNQGIPADVVYFIKKVRDSLNVSPSYTYSDTSPERKRFRQEEYIRTVNEVRDVVMKVKTQDDAMASFDNFFVGNGYMEKVDVRRFYQVTDKGRKNSTITNKLSKTMYVGSPYYFEVNFTRKAAKEQFGVPKDQKIPKGYGISFYNGKSPYKQSASWKENTYYVTKKYSILQANFETREEALAWVKTLVKESTSAQSTKAHFTPPQLAHICRTGPTYHGMQEITGDDYMSKFGFRGGEYGNWMSQKDRKASLNMGYDALMDLSRVLGIETEDISFCGKLAIAFGSRGVGSAVAHYEPLRTVINLTKMRGAGSLAHEWWHSLDDYLGTQMGAGGFLSECPDTYESAKELVDTIRYRMETPEEAENRVDEQVNRYKKLAGSFLDKLMEKGLHGDEAEEKFKEVREDYLAGKPDSIERIASLYKRLIKMPLSSPDKHNLEIYARFLKRSTEETVPFRVETQYLINSRKMSQYYEKDGNYWESNIEMTARAFACYIKDRLAPYISDYLAGHADTAVGYGTTKDGTTEMIKAFPEGEERKKINEAFDKFFEALKKDGYLTKSDSYVYKVKKKYKKNKFPTELKNQLRDGEQISFFDLDLPIFA